MITPLEKYTFIATFIRFFLHVCGSNFIDGTMYLPKVGQTYLFLVCFGISSGIYTVVTAEADVSMQAVVFVCIASQV